MEPTRLNYTAKKISKILQISPQPEKRSVKSAESEAAHEADLALEVTIPTEESTQVLANFLQHSDLNHVLLFTVILLFIVRLIVLILILAQHMWTLFFNG